VAANKKNGPHAPQYMGGKPKILVNKKEVGYMSQYDPASRFQRAFGSIHTMSTGERIWIADSF